MARLPIVPHHLVGRGHPYILAPNAQLQCRRRRLLHPFRQPFARWHSGYMFPALVPGVRDLSLDGLELFLHLRGKLLAVQQLARPDFLLLFDVVPRQRIAVQENDLVRAGHERLSRIRHVRESHRKRRLRRRTKPFIPKPNPDRHRTRHAHRCRDPRRLPPKLRFPPRPLPPTVTKGPMPTREREPFDRLSPELQAIRLWLDVRLW